MKTNRSGYYPLNYSDLYFDTFFQDETDCAVLCPEHVMVFVYSGELVIEQGVHTETAGNGEIVFIRRDIRVVLTKRSCGGEKFRGVFMGFSPSFLMGFYCNLDKRKIPCNAGSFPTGIIKLPPTPYIQSLYVSMIPYFHWGVKPSRNLLELKMQEAIYNLLLADDRFYACLFGANDMKEMYCYKSLLDFSNCN